MINKAILVGNVGKDAEVRHLEGGSTVAKFTLATSDTWKDKSGQKQTATEWHNVVCWRDLADLADKYIRKGMQLYVEGKITNRSYDDKDGVKRYTSEIIADTIRFLGKKEENGSGHTAGGKGTASTYLDEPGYKKGAEPELPPGDDVNGDDLPF